MPHQSGVYRQHVKFFISFRDHPYGCIFVDQSQMVVVQYLVVNSQSTEPLKTIWYRALIPPTVRIELKPLDPLEFFESFLFAHTLHVRKASRL